VEPRIPLDRERVADFCQRWQIVEFALFGSVLRDDFRPESDVDVLVSFAPNASWGLRDRAQMEDELRRILGRDVDLVERAAVERSENYIRRRHILRSLQHLDVA
jgi:predicted nucleotidyltransferase